MLTPPTLLIVDYPHTVRRVRVVRVQEIEERLERELSEEEFRDVLRLDLLLRGRLRGEEDGEEIARIERVALMRDGIISLWEEALRAWISG